MNSKVSKILSLVSGLIGLIAIYFLVRIIMEGDDAVKESLDLQNSLVSPFVSVRKSDFDHHYSYCCCVLALEFSKTP